MADPPGGSSAERAGMLVALISVLFTLATFGWTMARAGTSSPGYVQEGPMREVLAAGLILLTVGAVAVRLAGAGRWQPVIVRLVPAMAILGLTGHAVASILNPLEGVRAIVVPDYGHVLHPDQPGGTLWMFLLWGAPLAALAAPAHHRVELWLKLGALWLATYYAGVGLTKQWAAILEIGPSLPTRAGWAALIASLVVAVGLLGASLRQRRRGFPPT